MRFKGLVFIALLALASPVFAQGGSMLSFSTRPAALPSANTEIPSACTIIWRNADTIYCMDSAGGNVTQLTPTIAANSFYDFVLLDHVAASPQRGHIAISYLDGNGFNHCGIYDLAGDTYTPILPYFQTCGYGGIDWDLSGYLYFAGRERAPYELDTAVTAEAQANAAAYEIWKIKYDGTGLQKVFTTSTHAEADVSVSEDGLVLTWASTRVESGYSEIWVGAASGSTSAMVYQSTDLTRTMHDPELNPTDTQVAFSKRDPDQPLQFGIRPHEIFKCTLTDCTGTLTQVSPVGDGPICILPDWMNGVIMYHVLEDDGTPYQGPATVPEGGGAETRILHGPSAPKFIETDAVVPLPDPEADPDPPANLLVQYPSFGIHGNPAADGAVTTAAQYLADSTSKATAITKATNLGTDHQDLTIKWVDVEATVGNYTWTRITQLCSGSIQPLVLNIAPIWDDGTKQVPADIAGVAWDSASMSNAYKNMLTALAAVCPGHVWQLGVGNEADVYFLANPTEVSKYATFLSNIRAHARTTFGVNPFVLTMSFRFSALATLLTTFAGPVNQLDFPSITYYATASADSTAVATAVSADLQSIQATLGGRRKWFLSEVGMTSDTPSSEASQIAGFYFTMEIATHIAQTFHTTMMGFTWYQLSDVSSAVRTSFGATSYGERSGIGIRDTANAAKDVEPMLASFLGGVTDTPPPPPPDPILPNAPEPSSPETGVTLNNPVLLDWSDDTNVTFTLRLTPTSGSTTNINTGGTSQYLFTGTPGLTYTWSLQACNNVGCRFQTTPDRTFTIIPPPLPAPTNLAITGPTDGATGVALNPTLNWTATGATSYVLRFGTSNPPTTVVYSGPTPQFTVSAASNNTLYRWSIDAINSSGLITLSGSFTTEAAAGVATHPVLLVTAARVAAWDAMKADYVGSATTPKCTDVGYTEQQKIGCTIYRVAADKIASTGAEDLGLENAIFSRVTGNNANAQCSQAYTRAAAHGLVSLANPANINVNVFREHGVDYVLVYDLCYDQWTQPQRDTYLTKLNELWTFSANRQPSWLSCSDVDQPITEYLGFVAYYFATKDYNPTAVSLATKAHLSLVKTTLHCSPIAVATVGRTGRNMLAQFYTQSVGGAWIEGSEYSSSAYLGLIGCQALAPVVAAADICDEVDAYIDDWAQYMTNKITRDSGYAMTQADDGNGGHDLWDSNFRVVDMRIMLDLLGVLPNNTTRQNLYRVLMNFRATHSGLNLEPYYGFIGRTMSMANPYVTASADLSGLSNCYRSPGYGVYLYNDGLLTTASQFMTHFPPAQRGIDHSAGYWGNLGLYRRGQYAVSSMSVYGPGNWPEGTNTSLVEGLAPPTLNGTVGYKAETGYTCGSDYMYVSGTTGGSHVVAAAAGNYDVANFYHPARFIHEWTKSVVYLPSSTQTYDNIVTIERINALDPVAQPRFSDWTNLSPKPSACYVPTGSTGCHDFKEENKPARINYRPRWTRFQQHWYDPTVVGNNSSWTTTNGDLVTQTWLAPDDVTTVRYVNDLVAGWNDGTQVQGTERGRWHTEREPVTNVQWNCLFDVLSARNSGAAAPTLTELTPTGNMAGVLITRTGNDDRVVVANCEQGPDITQTEPTTAQATAVLSVARFKGAGSFTVAYTQTTANAKVLLLDLNPALSWAYTLNGGASTPITEDSGGLEELAIGGGAGVKTLVVTGT